MYRKFVLLQLALVSSCLFISSTNLVVVVFCLQQKKRFSCIIRYSSHSCLYFDLPTLFVRVNQTLKLFVIDRLNYVRPSRHDLGRDNHLPSLWFLYRFFAIQTKHESFTFTILFPPPCWINAINWVP